MAKHLKRHNRWDIFIHWFNFVLWMLLLITGLGLISNENIDPVGGWWPDALRAVTGGGANLLLIHEILGVVWILGFVLYLLFNFQGAKVFLRESFSVDLRCDVNWMIKKPIHMLFGDEGLKKAGMKPGLPPQGFYNMGQKAFAMVAVVGGVVLALTGIVMILSQNALTAEQTWLAQWSILLHYVFAGLIFAGLLVHVYMAALAPEERPAFRSMFTGTVPADFAKHHHRLWYDKVVSKDGEE
ncbi:cytochrome b/b6 domain-containing protein [Desulfohalovibrio reitneri]|uniref:cytochrome b/b6 domain-containing protein n=1 Tax=Desulfohalovibrio reitneri TaxID=1307759 RepID=UPI0004A7074E|nr:cytochrome b/b6 domain-containing protein [Desulfohalovibrio reitneri]